MSNFIYDNGTLPYPKTNLVAVPSGADLTKYVQHTDWNAVCQALVDVQGVLRGAEWLGITPSAGDPAPVGIANYLWVDGTTLTLTLGGTTHVVAAGTTGVVPGSYTFANITVDALGRITAATSGVPSGISAQNEGLAISGGPFSALNFVGDNVTITDQGGGVALVTIAGTAIRSLKYTATGSEGADFDVAVSPAMATANYGITWGPAGIQNVPLLDLPDGVGDRTASKFRVLIGGEPLQAGEVLEFFLVPR